MQSLEEDRSIIIKQLKRVPEKMYGIELITQLKYISNLVIHLLILKSRRTTMSFYHNLQERAIRFLTDYTITS